MTKQAIITGFRGPYAFLSNFHPARTPFDGFTWPTSEHAYQAAKSADIEHRQAMVAAPTPGRAKRLGQQCRLREDWDRKKLLVMLAVVRSKFQHNPDLAIQLMDTHPTPLVEGNTWGDRFWGMVDGQGENHLGRILMRVRDELLSQMDREVAHRVLGYFPCPHWHRDVGDGRSRQSPPCDCRPMHLAYDPENPRFPQSTTRPRDTRALIRHLVRQGVVVDVSWSGHGGVHVTLDYDRGNKVQGHGNELGPTLCRLALQWVDITKGEEEDRE